MFLSFSMNSEDPELNLTKSSVITLSWQKPKDPLETSSAGIKKQNGLESQDHPQRDV